MHSWVEMAKKGKRAAKSIEDQKLDSASQDKPPKQSAPKGAEIKPMPKTAADRKKDRIDGIIKTVYASVLGTLSGFLCFYATGIANQRPMQWLSTLLFVIALTYLVQKYTYPLLKINVDNFQAKDWLYVEFMAICLWLVTWTILLN
jgi:EMC6-arch